MLSGVLLRACNGVGLTGTYTLASARTLVVRISGHLDLLCHKDTRTSLAPRRIYMGAGERAESLAAAGVGRWIFPGALT